MAGSRAKVLTKRQAQVAALVAEGLSNAVIASRLGVSEQAVKQQVSRLFVILGVRNRVDLARRALARRAKTLRHEALRDVLGDAPVLAAITRGPEHVIEFASQALNEYAGRPSLVGMPIRGIDPQADVDAIVSILDRVFDSQQVHAERRYPIQADVRRSGVPEERLLDFVVHPDVDADGRTEGLILVATDVTEQARHEQRPGPEAVAVDRLGTGIAVLGAQGELVMMNEVGWRIAGGVRGRHLALAEGVGSYRVRDPRDGRPLAPEETPVGRALRGEAVADFEHALTRPADGRDVRVRVSAAPMRDSAGAIIGVICAFAEVAPEPVDSAS